MDKQCKHATPEKLAERAALLASKRAARKAEWDKVKGTGGAAKLAGATGAADDADEAMMNRLFEGDAPVEVDLAALIGDGTNARSLMARANSVSTATTTNASSVATPSNAGDSTAGGSTAGNEASIYVVGNTGDDTEDSISAGIFVGTWSNLTSSNAIVPFINKSYLENQMLLDTKRRSSCARRSPTASSQPWRAAAASASSRRTWDRQNSKGSPSATTSRRSFARATTRTRARASRSRLRAHPATSPTARTSPRRRSRTRPRGSATPQPTLPRSSTASHRRNHRHAQPSSIKT
jgi:hypothetical protein